MRGKELNAVCERCGKAFHVKPSALKHTRFCSKECYDAAQFKGKTVQCATCGNEVKVSPSLVRERNFCSNECRLAWLRGHVRQQMNIPGHSAGHKAPQIEVRCEACGKPLLRYPSQIRNHVFCSRVCAKNFTSARMHAFNLAENPMNTSAGWSDAQKEAVRQREQAAKGKCKPDTYPKYHGKHEHRVVAEKMLGRPLRPGEVVHHIDRNRHNNSPENLMIFPNAAAHTKWHWEHGDLKGGDAV